MTKLEQMDELIKKVQEDAELQKEIAAILQSTTAEDTVKADQWLADNGYEFTLRELVEHLEDGLPLSDEQLEAVAGGKGSYEEGLRDSGKLTLIGAANVGVGALFGGLCCALL